MGIGDITLRMHGAKETRSGPLRRRCGVCSTGRWRLALTGSSSRIPKLPDNPIVYVNAAFERITGYRWTRLWGTTAASCRAKTAPSRRSTSCVLALGEERECRVVLRNYRKDGTPFWNELYISPVHDEEGRLTNFVGIQNDMTEWRRIEDDAA